MAGAPTRAQRMRDQLRERRVAHLRRGRIYRGLVVLAGLSVTLAGLALLVLPGPAFVVIPIGLAMLALEFAWAERLLDKALEQADVAERKASEASPAQRVVVFTGTALAAAAAITAAWLWDIPVLPF
jgi:tellurite resistance protein TerC